MAPFSRASFLVLLSSLLLLASGDYGEAPTSSRQNHHEGHQHHSSAHHHRNPGSVSWSARHNAHTAQYPHSRHNHHESPLRRDSRLLGYRSLSRTSFNPTPAPATSTSTVTSTSTSTSSRSGSRSSAYLLRPREERLSALSALAEPNASRSVTYSTVVRQDAQSQRQQQQRENFGSVFPGVNVATTPPGVYNKFQPGRRVCSRTSEATSLQTHHHRSRQPRLAYNTDLPSGFLCCPGWTQVTRLSFGCNKPVCSLTCQNGGVCSSPGRCTCPKGFTGNYCQIDVDECITEKPCDQICRNVPGTYECYCRSGYQLQPDRQSCRKNDSDGTAFEARDLEDDFEETTTTTTRRPILRDTENEVGDGEEETSYEDLLRRLIKLEKQLAKGKKREAEANEITTRIAAAIDSINEIRRSIQNMQLMQQEIYELRNKVKLYEFEARKIQHLNNRVIDLENRLRLRCRSGVYLNSGSSTY